MNRTEIARQTLAQHTVAHLRQLASEANIAGRSKMRKAELVEALLPTTLAEMTRVEENRAVSRETEAAEDVQLSPVATEVEQDWAAEVLAPRSGYTECECRDCFDITIGGSVCHHCEEAGCSDDGDQECYRDDAYQS